MAFASYGHEVPPRTAELLMLQAAREDHEENVRMNESRPKSERVDLWQWSSPSSWTFHGSATTATTATMAAAATTTTATTMTCLTATRTGTTKIGRHTHKRAPAPPILCRTRGPILSF